MIQKIRENIPILFSLSLVMSYFGCTGYYSYFHIDVGSYLTIGDLTIIYARYVWLTVPCLLFPSITLYRFFNDIDKKSSWWGVSIFKGRVKRRAIIIGPLFLAIGFLAYFFTPVRIVLFYGGAVIFYVALLGSMLLAAYVVIGSKNSAIWDEIAMVVIVFCAFGVITPMIVGYLSAKYAVKSKIIVTMENKTVIKTNDTIQFVGKTSDYFFIYNSKTQALMTYRVDKVQSFEQVPNYLNK